MSDKIQCTAMTRHEVRCSNSAVRAGLCLYHQPEEQLAKLNVTRERLVKEIAAVDARILAVKSIDPRGK